MSAPNAKLTEDQVREIRKLGQECWEARKQMAELLEEHRRLCKRSKEISAHALAKKYGVHRNTIVAVQNYIHYGRVE